MYGNVSNEFHLSMLTSIHPSLLRFLHLSVSPLHAHLNPSFSSPLSPPISFTSPCLPQSILLFSAFSTYQFHLSMLTSIHPSLLCFLHLSVSPLHAYLNPPFSSPLSPPITPSLFHYSKRTFSVNPFCHRSLPIDIAD